MTANSLINEETKKLDIWDKEFIELFSTNNKSKKKYYKLISKQLVGLYIIIFINSSLKDDLKELEFDTVTRGILGVGGNKGAISIRFK
jgi:hypothetical protein